MTGAMTEVQVEFKEDALDNTRRREDRELEKSGYIRGLKAAQEICEAAMKNNINYSDHRLKHRGPSNCHRAIQDLIDAGLSGSDGNCQKGDGTQPYLRGCPFCGEYPREIQEGEDSLASGGGSLYRVGCDSCDFNLAWKHSGMSAVAAWNRRDNGDADKQDSASQAD